MSSLGNKTSTHTYTHTHIHTCVSKVVRADYGEGSQQFATGLCEGVKTDEGHCSQSAAATVQQ